MNTFNITKLTVEQLDTLVHDLPPIHNIPFQNVAQMLEPIKKNYPFIFLTYGYVLLSIGGTTVTIMVIGILYYAKYKRARGGVASSKRKQSSPSKEDNEIVSLQTTTNDQMIKYHGHQVTKSDSEPITSMATPLLIQKRLQENFGVDFSKYENYKKCKQDKLRRGSEHLHSIV